MRNASWVISAVTVVLGLGVCVGVAGAVSLGSMAEEAEKDLAVVSGFIEVVLYLMGVLVFAAGVFGLKRYMEQPGQVRLAAAGMTMLVGVALILTPVIINNFAGTFGLIGGAEVQRPKLGG